MSVPHSQYHPCWCTGILRSQCIRKMVLISKVRILSVQYQESYYHCYWVQTELCGSLKCQYSVMECILVTDSSKQKLWQVSSKFMLCITDLWNMYVTKRRNKREIHKVQKYLFRKIWYMTLWDYEAYQTLSNCTQHYDCRWRIKQNAKISCDKYNKNVTL